MPYPLWVIIDHTTRLTQMQQQHQSTTIRHAFTANNPLKTIFVIITTINRQSINYYGHFSKNIISYYIKKLSRQVMVK